MTGTSERESVETAQRTIKDFIGGKGGRAQRGRDFVITAAKMTIAARP